MPNFLYTALLADTYRELRYRSALILYFLVVVIGCIPGARADAAEYASGVVLHSFGYGVLTLLLYGGSAGTPLARAIKAVLTVMLMGAFDEFIQSHFPYRHGSVSDWLVDCAAALTVSLLLWGSAPSWKRAAATTTP